MKILIDHIGLLMSPQGQNPLAGAKQGQVLSLPGAWVLVRDDKISAIGREGLDPKPEADLRLDAGGKLVTPGLVDAHTHLVFGGWRDGEFRRKLRGENYLDILKSGGGILCTMRQTREMEEEALFQKSLSHLREMVSHGTTACEAKSGYGLNMEDELKQLRCAARLNREGPLRLVSSLMAAHAYPPEFTLNHQAYIDLILNKLLPEVVKEGLASYCDVFCEEGAFSLEESRQILLGARASGLGLKIHADEMNPFGGAQLAAELKAVSAEHLLAANDEGINALFESGVTACLLPATSFYLNKPYARARKMMELGVPLALGTDFNPGSCPCLNLQFAMQLACLKLGMLPEEVLTAATLNAAHAIGLSQSKGSLEAGKDADLVIWDADNLEQLLSRFGSNRAQTVLVGGKIVREKTNY